MPAVIPIVAAVAGAAISANASKKAAKSQSKSAQAAIDAQVAAREQMRADLMPFTQGGLQGLAALTGNNYEASPGYAYLKDEMMGAVDARNANAGTYWSEGANLDMARHVNGLAAQDYNNWWSRNMGLAQLGQNSAAGVGLAGMNAANQIGSQYNNMGQAGASSALQQGGAWGGAITGIGGALNNMYSSSYTPAPSYNANNDTLAPYYTNGAAQGNVNFGR
jgi:hypothetical protein